MDETTKFMRRLDRQYRKASGLTDRRDYSIFYSRIVPCPTCVLGFNPGGSPDTWTADSLASTGFYENWEHEYVDCHYPIACTMRVFLPTVLSLADVEAVRRIPKTNLIFRRSSGQDTLNLSKDKLIAEAKPVLEQILCRVSPSVIICEGATTLDAFEKHYCVAVEVDIDRRWLKSPNGRDKSGRLRMATIYRTDRAHLVPTDSPVMVIGVGHPSKFGGRADWSEVSKRSRLAFRRFGPTAQQKKRTRRTAVS